MLKTISVDELAASMREFEALEAKTLQRAFDMRHKMARVYGSEGKGYVYASLLCEKESKKARLLLLVEYPDGSCSELINVSQEGIVDKSYNMIVHEAGTPIWLKNAKCLEVLRQYCRPDMDIDYVKIYCTLRKHYDELPEEEMNERYSLYEIYKRIQEVAEMLRITDNTNPEDYVPLDCEDYVLTTKAINKIADEAGYGVTELLQLMYLHNIMITDNGRFQKSMRIKGEHHRRYVFKHEDKLKDMIEKQNKKIKIISQEERPDVCTYKKSFKKWKP